MIQQYTSQTRMRDAVADAPALLMALSRFDISLGFGDATIGEVCEKAQVDTPTFLAVASLIGGKQRPYDSQVSLPALMAYLRNAHAYFIDFVLPEIRRKLIGAIDCAGGQDVTVVILKFYDDYVAEVRRHMDYENRYVFSYVDSLLDGRRPADFSIRQFEENHRPIAEKLCELKEIFICHYHGTAADNDRLNAVLFDIMNCEADLMSHCEVENHILIPAVEALERDVTLPTEEVNTRTAADDGGCDPDVHNLTEREKEIVRNIARGLSNKEIADRLFLSVHTVATHRRNICAKLDIHSAAALTIFAIIHHLIEVSEIRL